MRRLDNAFDFIHVCHKSKAALEQSIIEELKQVGRCNKQSQEVNKVEGFHPAADEAKEANYSKDGTLKLEKDERPQCSETLITKDELVIERLIENRDNRMKRRLSLSVMTCDVCGASLLTTAAVSYHLQCHGIKPERSDASDSYPLPSCRYCGEELSSGNWSYHLQKVHRVTEVDASTNRTSECEICLRPFSCFSELLTHTEVHHPNQLGETAETKGCVVWNCQECATCFLKESELVTHCVEEHGKKASDVTALKRLLPRTDTCECGCVWTTALEDTVHNAFCLPERCRPGPCPACDQHFSDCCEFQKHLVISHYFLTVGPEKKCLLCGVPCDSINSIKNHLKKHHGLLSKSESELDGGKSLTCDSCGTHFESKETLTEHSCLKSSQQLKNPAGKFPVKCPKCPKIFKTKIRLHKHCKRFHQKDADQCKCSYCGTTIASPAALRNHEERLHCELRPFPCPDCPLRFTTVRVLRKHSELHLAVRPTRRCPVCGREFTTVSGIQRHVQTHTGLKFHACTMDGCSKTFYTASKLRRHIKYHTRALPYECKSCERKFLLPGELRRHSLKHEGSELLLEPNDNAMPVQPVRRDFRAKLSMSK